ncbi:MAG TPA: hypothetical protein VJV75_09720 [Candidatus Polarisedimenticolia bacterium]|nr:hypothetical protein [Candidatus Polarisedimenticolia bacterium]
MFVLAAAAFGGLNGVAMFMPDERLVAAFHDDAFYYFGVARNLATGYGFTFDGIHRTNGFHPLWLGLICPVFGVTHGDATALRAIIALQIGLVTATAVAIYRALLRPLGPGAATAALALVAIPGSATFLCGGLESSLVLLIVVMLWVRFNRTLACANQGALPWFWIGVLCAAGLLARFEGIVLTLCCLALGFGRLRENPRNAAFLLAPTAVVAVAFALWNRVVFGTWIPISGLVKSVWASRAETWSRLDKFLTLPWLGSDIVEGAMTRLGAFSETRIHLILQILLLGSILAVGWRCRRKFRVAVRSSECRFLLLAAGAWVALDKFAGLDIEPWNRVLIHLCTAILIGALACRHHRLAIMLNVALLVFALARVPWKAEGLGTAGSSYAPYRLRAAMWLREQTPEDARIGSWNAGLLGYFSHRAVVNLDGLVNDRRYLEEVIVGRNLDGYLRREGIIYLADQSCGKEPSLGHYLSRTGSERLEPDFTVEAVFAERTPDGCPGYVIWRRRPSG